MLNELQQYINNKIHHKTLNDNLMIVRLKALTKTFKKNKKYCCNWRRKNTNLSGFVIAHDEVWGWHKSFGQPPSTAERAGRTGHSRAGRHTGVVSIRRLPARATEHRTAAEVVLTIPACAMGGLQVETVSGDYQRTLRLDLIIDEVWLLSQFILVLWFTAGRLHPNNPLPKVWTIYTTCCEKDAFTCTFKSLISVRLRQKVMLKH